MIVKVRRHHLDYFRKKAIKCPNEVYAVLVGFRASPTLVQIEYFKYPALEKQTPDEVIIDDHSYGVIEEDAKAYGFQVVGTIHSHPNWTQEMSKCDWEVHKQNGYHITGIVSVLSKKTFVTFWEAGSPLPCSIRYYKND